MQPSRAEMRRALEKKVLTFALADAYEKHPTRMALERGITFTPLPPRVSDRTNPASNTCCLVLDHDAKDPSPQKGNHLMPEAENGKNSDIET